MGNRQRERYLQNGLNFISKKDEGYTRFTAAFDGLSPADFASLSIQDLYDLVPVLGYTKYENIVNQAIKINKLVRQSTTIHKDGFPYPVLQKPYTWSLAEKISCELESQVDRLQEHGIDTLVGLEMEFSMSEEPIATFDHWISVKNDILLQLYESAELAESEDEYQLILDKIHQVQKFNAREVLMYDLIECDLRTRDIFESLFGINRDGQGYYDARGVLELKFKPVDPQTALFNRVKVLEILFEKAAEYGLVLDSLPSFHVNISFWDENGNIFDDSHPDFFTKGKALVEGIAKAFYDNIFVLLNKSEINSDELRDFEISVHRMSLLRYSSDRIEVRPSVHGSLQDPNIIIATFLAGALYGLSNQEKDELLKAHEVISPVVHHESGLLKVFSHVLSNSTIDEHGFLTVNEEYVRDHIQTLEYELGLVDEPPSDSLVNAIYGMFYKSEYLPFIIDFLQSTRVVISDENILQFDFPVTANGMYEFTIPSINIDKIPETLKKRLENGESIEVMRSEISRYLNPGDRMPQLARRCVINVASLLNSVWITDLHTKLVVKGYSVNNYQTSENVTPSIAWLRYDQLMNSRVLQEEFSKDFFKALVDITHDMLSANDVFHDEHWDAQQVENLFHAKILDEDWTVTRANKSVVSFWKENGQVEGRDFIKKAVLVKFKRIFDKDPFVLELHNVLQTLFVSLNKTYWYGVSVSNYSDNSADINLEIDPKLLRVLQKLL